MPNRLERALRTQDRSTQKKKTELAGTMGVNLNGVETVEVPNRAGFVYVMLNTKEQELIQAFNDKVSEVFGAAVIVIWNVNRYEVLRKDDIRYGTWNSSMLPKHGNQHSFNPDGGGGGDVTFIYGKQFVPLSLMPSGVFGAPNAIINPYSQQQSGWHYIPSTPTPNITQFRPTNNQARMVLVCMDWDTRTAQLIVGTGTFSANLTGSADVIPYLPSTTGVYQVPIAGVRLVSGTTAVTWQNIYDVRQYFHPIFTGTSAGGGGGGGGGGTGTSPNGNFYYNSSQNIVDGGFTNPLNLNTTLFNNGLGTLSGNKVQVSEGGTYRILINIGYSPVAVGGFQNGYVIGNLEGDSVSYSFQQDTMSGTGIDLSQIHIDTLQELNAGDHIWASFENETHGTLSVSVNEFSAFKVGGGDGTTSVTQAFSVGMMGWDEGVPLGTGTVLNFVGAGVTATLSGTVFNIDVSGGGGGGTGFVPYIGATQTVDLGGQALFTSGTSRLGTTQIQENHHLHLGANHQLFPFDADTFPTNSYIGFGDGNGGNLRLLEIYDESFGITNGQGTGTIFVAGWDANHQHIIGQLGDIEAQDFGNYIEVGRSGTVFKRDGFDPQNFYVNLSGTAISNGVPLVKEAPADGQVYGRQRNGWVILQTGTVSGGGTVFSGVDQIGIYALDDGVAIGTGSTVNFGNNLSVVRTGTTLFVDAVAGTSGGGTLGVMGWDEGVPLGTGTVLNAVGAGVTMTLSGTVLNLSIPGTSSGGSGTVVFSERDGSPIGSVDTVYTPNGYLGITGSSAYVLGYMELISRQAISGTGTVSFQNIPQTYRDLEIVMICRSSTSATLDSASIRLNNDTTNSNYRRMLVAGQGTNSSNFSGGDDSSIILFPAANSPSNSAGVNKMEILNYKDTTFNKLILGSMTARRDNSSIHQIAGVWGVEWENNAAVTRIDIIIDTGGATYVSGSEFRLYGRY